MKVLVTGARGRVGSCLVRELLKNGYSVRGVDLHPDQEMPSDPGYEYIPGDLLDPSVCSRIIADVQAVVHIAGVILFDDRQSRRILDINWRTTFELLEAMAVSGKTFERFVFASSGQVYPDNPDGLYLYNPIDEMHPPRPVNYYGLAKLASEETIWMYMRKYRIPGVVTRFTHVQYPWEILDPTSEWSGPRFFVNARLASIQKMAKTPVIEETIHLLESVAQKDEQLLLSCDMNGVPNEMVISHPEDISQAILLTLEKDAAVGQIYNIGASDPFNFGTMIPYLSKGIGMPYVSLNLPLNPYHGRTSNAKIRAQLGYKIKYDPFCLAEAAIAVKNAKEKDAIQPVIGD